MIFFDLPMFKFLEKIFRRYECGICKRRFRRIEFAMQHEQVIHGSGKMYHCQKCNLGFFGMEQMRDHIKKFHSYGPKTSK